MVYFVNGLFCDWFILRMVYFVNGLVCDWLIL